MSWRFSPQVHQQLFPQQKSDEGVSDPLCKGVTSNLNRGSGSTERTRDGAGDGHWRGGTTSPGCR